MQHYYVDANGCAAHPGAPDAMTRREAVAYALRAACHPGDLAVIIRADSVEQRGPNIYWRGGRVIRAFRGDSRLVRALRGGAYHDAPIARGTVRLGRSAGGHTVIVAAPGGAA